MVTNDVRRDTSAKRVRARRGHCDCPSSSACTLLLLSNVDIYLPSAINKIKSNQIKFIDVEILFFFVAGAYGDIKT